MGETHRKMQWIHGGAYAEFISVPADVLARKPEKISFEQAAAIPTAGIIALNNLQPYLRSEPSRRVLINGDGDGVGSIAIQFVKAAGADVTGVDHTKLDYVRSIGAETVVDYTKIDGSSAAHARIGNPYCPHREDVFVVRAPGRACLPPGGRPIGKLVVVP